MAELAVSSGNTIAGSQIGRDVVFLTFSAGNAVLNAALPDVNGVTPSLTNLDLVRRVVDSASTITMVGVNSTSEVAFMVEGMGFNDGTTDPMTQQAELNEIRDQVEALNASALGTVVCTISQLENDTLVVLLTDT